MAEAAAAPVRAARALGPRGLGPRKAGAQHTVPQAPGGLPGQTGPAGPRAAASGREVRRGLPDRVEPGAGNGRPRSRGRPAPSSRSARRRAGASLPQLPQRPGGTWEVSDVDSAYTEHPLCVPGPPRAAREGCSHLSSQAGAVLSPV